MGKASKKATSSKTTRAEPRTKDAAVHLFDLPESCLHRIVGHMDGSTRTRFFKASKGSGEQPGCAILLLKTGKPTYTFIAFSSQGIESRLAHPSGMLRWVSQHSSNVHVRILGSGVYVPSFDVILGRLLVFQQHKDYPRAVEYPGVTSLEVMDCRLSELISTVVTDAFPHLTRLSISSVALSGLAVMVKGVAARIQHLTLWHRSSNSMPHVVKQLSHMRSLTSLDTVEKVLLAAPARVLNKLTQLVINSNASPQPKAKAALDICIRLSSLTLYVGPHHLNDWLAILPREDPNICELDLPDLELSDATPLTHILALPHLTKLGIRSLAHLSEDVSAADCKWQELSFIESCSSHVAKLPLHTLDSPIECWQYSFYPSADHAADIAAITAARPHLIRCGGIRPGKSEVYFDTSDSPTITKEQAAELLEAWAPCFSEPIRTITGTGPRAKAVLGAAKVWSDVEIVVDY